MVAYIERTSELNVISWNSGRISDLSKNDSRNCANDRSFNDQSKVLSMLRKLATPTVRTWWVHMPKESDVGT